MMRRRTEAEARVLIRRWQVDGDERARAAVVEQYMPLVWKWVKKYPGTNHMRDDAVQEGAIALMRAIDGFDASKGTNFATYASLWIRSYLLTLIRSASSVQRLRSRDARELFNNLGEHMRTLARDCREATPEAIAEVAGVKVDTVQRVLGHVRRVDVDLDTPSALGSRSTKLDALSDGRPGADELLDAAREEHAAKTVIALAMSRLTEREQHIVRRRRLEEPGATLAELGEELGVTRERIRQIEARALKKVAATAGAPPWAERPRHTVTGRTRPRSELPPSVPFDRAIARLCEMKNALAIGRGGDSVPKRDPEFVRLAIDASERWGLMRVSRAIGIPHGTLCNWRRRLVELERAA